MALVHLWTKLDEIVLDGQPSGGSSPEKALIANITKLVKDELKRSVSCIFYCVLVRLFTNFVILATAAPAYQGWGRKTLPGYRRLSRGDNEGDHPVSQRKIA